MGIISGSYEENIAGAAMGRDLNIGLKVFAKGALLLKLQLFVKCTFGHI